MQCETYSSQLLTNVQLAVHNCCFLTESCVSVTQALEQLLTYRAQATTSTNCDRPAHRHEFRCRGYAAVVTTVVSPFELDAQRVEQHGVQCCPALTRCLSLACNPCCTESSAGNWLQLLPASHSLLRQSLLVQQASCN